MTLFEKIQDRPGFKKQSAKTWEGPCPKCGGTKRMVVWIHNDIFKCRDCDFKGDMVKWLREVEGYSCREAFLVLGKDCETPGCSYYEKCKGNTAPRRQQSATVVPTAAKSYSDWQPRPAEEPAEAWRLKAAEFVAWAHEQLLNDSAQLNYLASRGLPLEAVKQFTLGWNPGELRRGKMGPLFRQRSAWGLEPKWNEKDQKWVKILAIQRGIIIPSFYGEDVYRIRIRRPDEDLAEYPEDEKPAKYLFLEGSGKGLIVRSRSAKAFVVVESDLCDLLIQYLAGDLVCPVALTSCNIRPDSDSAVILSEASCILNALDYEPRENKTTGQYENPGGQNARWWQKHFPQSERWPVPVGKDPGEAYKLGADIREWIILGLPVSLQPSRANNNEKTREAAKVSFNPLKAQQMISDAHSRIKSSCPSGAMDWLNQNRPDILRHLASAGSEVDAAYEAEDEARLNRALDTWEKWHAQAWQRYQERPTVIDVEEHQNKGETDVH